MVTTAFFSLKVLTVKPFGTLKLSGESAFATASAYSFVLYPIEISALIQ